VSGFGLISTANNSTPFSEFIVRADRFAIGSPSGPGITPKVPFVVLTTTDAEGNAPGVYIDSAIIKNAAIGTLKLDGEAVFVSRWATGNGGNTYSSTRVAIVTLNLPIAGLATGETAPMIVQGYSNYSPIDGSGASVYIDISVNDTIITPSFGVSVFGDATFSGNSAQVNLPNGTHVVKLLIKIDSPGVSSKYLNVNAVLIAMSGKR
jgi:hypothetical protein